MIEEKNNTLRIRNGSSSRYSMEGVISFYKERLRIDKFITEKLDIPVTRIYRN